MLFVGQKEHQGHTRCYGGTLTLHHAVDADREYDDLRVESHDEWREQHTRGRNQGTRRRCCKRSTTGQQSAGTTDHGQGMDQVEKRGPGIFRRPI